GRRPCRARCGARGCPSWELLRGSEEGREGMARHELLHHTPSAPCAQAFSQIRPRFVISSSSPWRSGGAVGADRDLPVTARAGRDRPAGPCEDRAGDAPTAPGRGRRGRADRSVRALPPPGIAFHVVLVAPPRSVRGPGRAEWVPSAETSNGPLPSRGTAPPLSAAPATDPAPSPALRPDAPLFRRRTATRPAISLGRTAAPPLKE